MGNNGARLKQQEEEGIKEEKTEEGKRALLKRNVNLITQNIYIFLKPEIIALDLEGKSKP